MNVWSSRTLCALIALAGTSTIAVAAHAAAPAGMDNEAPSVVVNYADVDITSDAGARQLYSRLKAAARNVCSPLAGRSLENAQNYHRCYNTALEAAVKTVDHSTLSALHMQTHRGTAS